VYQLEGGGRTVAHRRGNVVIRDTGPWTPAVHALLRHLEDVGFRAAPRLAGSGFDPDGRETLTFIDGEFTHPGPWSLEGAAALGGMLRDLHEATRSFRPPAGAAWFRWHGRDLGGPTRVIGHCDLAPWNIAARAGMPVAFIDWEFAGPVDPLVELAQLCWLNTKLNDDIVAERDGPAPPWRQARPRWRHARTLCSPRSGRPGSQAAAGSRMVTLSASDGSGTGWPACRSTLMCSAIASTIKLSVSWRVAPAAATPGRSGE
jgi:hypothetical protein